MSKNKTVDKIRYIGYLLFFAYGLFFSCEKVKERANFRIVGKCSNPGYAQSIWIDTINFQHNAFIASGQAGLVIYNIENPEMPNITAQWLDSANTCQAVTISRHYAFLAYGNHELKIIDIAKLDSIKWVNTTSYFTSFAYDIFAADSQYIYIGAKDRLIVADVSNPQFPDYISEYTFPSVRGVFVVDSFAYLASEQVGVYIMNVKIIPRIIVGNVDTPSNARGVFVLGKTCYVADGRGGLVIIDITNPQNAAIVGKEDLPGYAMRVFVKDTLAYIACGSAGLCIVNVKDKNKPYLVQTVKTSYAKAVFAPKGQYVYVADRDEGLVIIKEE